MEIWEAILLIVAFALFIFMFFRDYKKRQDRESYDWWIAEVREHIHCIECDFRRDCEQIITNAFSGRNVSGEIVIDKHYYSDISKLEKEYKGNLYDKIVAKMGKNRIKSVPEHLSREYDRAISEIAYNYLHFGDFMLEQIKDVTKGDYHWKMNY